MALPASPRRCARRRVAVLVISVSRRRPGLGLCDGSCSLPAELAMGSLEVVKDAGLRPAPVPPLLRTVRRPHLRRAMAGPEPLTPVPSPAPAAPSGTSQPASPALRSTTAVALAVAIAHGTNDAYSAFLHPLLPRIMERLDLSIALAASLAMTLSLAASAVQPVMGYLADRFGRKPFVVLGPVLSAVFLSLIGVAPSFAVLALFLALGGLGSAMFHPPGASMAARVGAGRGSGMRASFFSFGGAVGYAAGPLAAVGIVSVAGLDGLWVAMLPMLILAVVLWRVLPADRPRHDAAAPPGLGPVLRALRGPLGVVFGISAVAAFVQRVYLTMQPISIAAAGGSEAAGAVALSVYLGAQAVGSLTGGTLADRLDRRTLLFAGAALSFPAHALALWLPFGSAPMLTAAAAAGFLNMALLPPVVVMAQEIMPAGAAVSAGVVMGLAWATGSIVVLGTGILGDVVGARDAALLSVPLSLVGAALALHPAIRPFRRAPH
jgi:MFS transporter, FSR family, fosmidomycin resistance protein